MSLFTHLFMNNLYDLLSIFIEQRNKKKKVQQLELTIKEHPEFKEKAQVEKLKISSDVKRDLEITGKGFVISVIITFITIIILVLRAPLIAEGGTNASPILGILSAIFIFLSILVLIIVLFLHKQIIKKNIFNFLMQKYGIVEKLKKPSKKLVFGKEYVRDSIRNCYNFSYKILKYNCIFSNYNQEKYQRVRYSKRTQYSYIKINNFMEYCYNLKNFDVENIDGNILNQPNIKKVIEELSKIKIIKVSIKDDYLVIEKETILNNYNSEDAKRDVDDVEFFYNEIVQKIMEVK